MAVVEIHNVTYEFAPGRGICDVDLRVEPGQCLAILGRNGSGKSTLLRLVSGALRPGAGHVTVLGHPVGEGSRGHLCDVGIVPESSVHWEGLSARQNAFFAGSVYGLTEEEIQARSDLLWRACALTDRVDDPVSTYSLGMRRKLTIAEALLHDPELLLLDEPTHGLDAQGQMWLAEAIDKRSARGRTTLLSSNDPEWVSGVAGQLAFLSAGSVSARGPIDEFLGQVSGVQDIDVVLEEVVPVPAPRIDGLKEFRQDGPRLNILLDDNPALVSRLVEWLVASGLKLKRMDVRHGTLRDAFLLVTGDRLDP